MPNPNLIILYVNDPLKSAKLYEKLFGNPPSVTFPTYVSFEFPNGLSLGLWSVNAKNFISGGTGNRSELAFMVSNEDEVRAFHKRWCDNGVKIEQDLHEAVFGLTFVAHDDDGHRIRVCM